MNCPECNTELEQVAGNLETGVVAPDGYKENYWQEGMHCPKCRYTYDVDDLLVPCSYPRCSNRTTRDPVYGDLCYAHIRAEDE